MDEEETDFVSVHLLQAGTSGRTADREKVQVGIGEELETIGPDCRRHKVEAV